MKKLLFIFSFFFLFVLNGKTQEVEILTLEDCLRIGIDNNLSLEGKRKEIQRSKYGVSENRSKLLPQINAIAVIVTILILRCPSQTDHLTVFLII